MMKMKKIKLWLILLAAMVLAGAIAVTAFATDGGAFAPDLRGNLHPFR